MNDEPELQVGASEGHHLRIRPLWRERAGDADYWDGNWVTCDLSVNAAPFSGVFRASLRTDELSNLREQLTALRDDLSGTAELRAMDGQLFFRIVGDGLGHFSIQGEAKEDPGSGIALRFEFTFDQTEIADMLRSLRRFEDLFPVVGQADV